MVTARRLAPLACFVTLLYAVLGAVLATPGGQTRDVALVEVNSGFPLEDVPLPLARDPSDEVEHAHWIRLAAPDAARLVKAESIDLRFATYHDACELGGAELRFGGAACLYSTDPGSQLQDNAHLTFRRRACADPDPSGLTGDVELVVRSRGAPNLALWTTIFYSGSEPSGMLLSVPTDAAKQPAYVSGSYRPPPAPAMTRLALLAHVWRIGQAGVLGVLTFAYLAVLWGAALTCRGIVVPGQRGATAVAVGALFFGLSCTYAVVVPPFQAPDEPDHLLGIADLTGSPSLASGALTLAQVGHFERIKFRRDERFTSVDAGEPSARLWAPHIAPPASPRSILSSKVWGSLGKPLASLDAGVAVLALRIFNSLIAALFLCLALRIGRVDGGSLLAGATLALVHAPSLPFFSMHISNYVFLVGSFFFQLVALIAVRQRVGLNVCVLIGAGLALAVASGIGGIATISFWCVTLTAWAVFLPRPAKGRQGARECLKLVGVGAAAYAAVLLVLGQTDPLFWVASGFSRLCGGDGPSALACRYPRGVTALAFAGSVPVVWLVGESVQRALERRPQWRRRLGRIGAAAAVLLFLASWLAGRSGLPDIEGAANIELMRYVRKAVVVFFSAGVGFGKPDFYVASSFWAGFGWLETLLPPLLIWLVKVVPTLALLGVTVRLLKSNGGDAGREGVIAGGTLVGIATYIAILALGCWKAKANLHGRYLIGAYLFYMGLAFSLWTRGTEIASIRGSLRVLLLGQGAVHAYALTFLITRYL